MIFKLFLLAAYLSFPFLPQIEHHALARDYQQQKENTMEYSLSGFDQWWKQATESLPEEKMSQAYAFIKQITPREQIPALELLKEKLALSTDDYRLYFQNHPLLNWLNALFVMNPMQLPRDILTLARQHPALAIEDCLTLPAEQQVKVIQLLTQAEQTIAENKKQLASLSNAETELGDDISQFLKVLHARQKQLKDIF